MGFLRIKGHVRSYILIFLVFAAFLISVPVKRSISNSINKKINEFTKEFSDLTGLTVKYKSFSPSVLSYFYITGISVQNSENKVLLEIDKTRVNYKLSKIIKKDIQSGITNVVIDGITLNLTELVDLYTLLKDRFNTQNIDLNTLNKLIPQNIKLKNIYFEFENEKINTVMSVKNIGITNNPEKRTLGFQLDSLIKADVENVRNNLSCKMEVNGTFSENFNNSHMNIKLSDLTDGIYKLSKLNLHVSYIDNVIEAHTIQTVNPISVGVSYDIKSGDVNASLMTEKFSPVSLLTKTSKQSELRKFKDLLIDTNTVISSNVNKKSLEFTTETKSDIPETLIPGGAKVSVSVIGDEKGCTVTEFLVDGSKYNMHADLSYVYDTYQLAGFVEIPKFVLSNGNVVSTELYIDPFERGFMAFSPQLFVGERALTALQLNLLPQDDYVDFTFEMSDYSHLESSEPGMLKMEGSYLPNSKYVQTNVSLNSIYLDTISGLSSQFLQKNMSDKINQYNQKLSPYMLSGDVYLSTDLKSVSYNVPYILLANTQVDNQVLMFSVNGTEDNIQLNQMSLVFGKYAMNGTASLDKSPDSSDVFLTADFNAEGIPYHLSGSVMPDVCTITGDYGTDIVVNYNKKGDVSGHAYLTSFPLSVLNHTVTVTTETDFTFDEKEGPKVNVQLFEVEGTDSNVSVNPKITMAGNVTKYGAQINSIAYTDLYSALQGTSDVMLNINGGMFDSVSFMLNVKNPITEESIVMDCNVSNPDHLALTKENILKYIYMNLQIQLNDFSLNRFALQKNENNYITGSLNASGTIEHPYVALSLDEVSVLLATKFIKAEGGIILEDRDLTINNLNLYYSNWLNIKNINATASLDKMNLDATGELDCYLFNKNVYAPLFLTAGNAIIPDGKFVPDSLDVTLSTPAFSGELLKKEFPLSFTAIYNNKNISLFSSANAGVNGMYTSDGLLELSVDNKDFLKFNLDGLVNFKTANLELYDFDADLHKLCSYLNFDDLFTLEKGEFTGEVIVTGSLNNPDLNGNALLAGLEINSPVLTNQKITAADIDVSMVNNEITVNNAVFGIKSGQKIETFFTVFLNKWSLDHIEGSVNTVKNQLFPVKMKSPYLEMTGNFSTDLKLYYEEHLLDVSGKLFADNLKAETYMYKLSSLNTDNNGSSKKNVQIITDISVTLGTHSSVNLDPVIRCVFVPNTKLDLKIDQSNEIYFVDGELKLKSGDVAYLNRNFYIKSGVIKFNPDNISNPLITINAETREKDERGQTVKIILDVEKQYLLDFVPRFTSIPAKSENEILTMLGQIVVADSSSATNFIFAASDYAIQSAVMRKAENKLRDLLNFDIFSVRTNLLQNTLNMGVSGELSKENLSIGNFLDNTTVYIGKYLGSSLYLDAMLHVSFENGTTNNLASAGNLIFQPEFGMEMESPFANIRVNMAPDINALLHNQFVPSPSVTLSWKLQF